MTRAFDPDSVLDYMQLVSPDDGTSLLIHQAITQAPEFAQTIDGASTLNVTVADHNRRLARSEAFTTRSWATALGINFELVGASKSGDSFTLTFEDAIAAQLRRQKKKLRIPANSTTRRELLIRLAKEAGVKYSIDPAKMGKVHNVVERVDSDSWELSSSLAGDVNWRRFSNGKRLVAGSDAWLTEKDTAPTLLRENTGPVHDIDFNHDVGKKKRAQAVTVTLDAEFGALNVGDVALIEDDYPATAGKWLIDGYTYTLGATRATATMSRRVHALKEPKGTGGKGETGEDGFVPDRDGDAGGGKANSAAREKMVSFALAQDGDKYVWGGNGPDAWDCSGLIQAATAAAGKTLTKPAQSQWDTCVNAGVTISVADAIKTRGALLFRITAEGDHAVISLGNGSTIEAMGSAYGVLVAGNAGNRGFTGGALWI